MKCLVGTYAIFKLLLIHMLDQILQHVQYVISMLDAECASVQKQCPIINSTVCSQLIMGEKTSTHDLTELMTP